MVAQVEIPALSTQTAANTTVPALSNGAPHSYVLETAPAAPGVAAEHFTRKLALETDAWDVHADLCSGVSGFVVVDARSAEAYAEGHIPGAISLPYRQIVERTLAAYDKSTVFITYCTSPGCNASTKGAVRLAALGYRVKEMIGGFEYWQREGYPVERGGPTSA